MTLFKRYTFKHWQNYSSYDTKGEHDTELNRKSAIKQQLMQENNILQSLSLTADIMETHDVIQALTIVWAVETEKGKKKPVLSNQYEVSVL